MRKVIGSSPISSTKKKTTPFGVVFLFGMVLEIGLEQFKYDSPVDCRWFPSSREPHLNFIESYIVLAKGAAMQLYNSNKKARRHDCAPGLFLLDLHI